MNDNIPASRVWNLTAPAMQDGAVLSVHTYTVKVECQGEALTVLRPTTWTGSRSASNAPRCS